MLLKLPGSVMRKGETAQTVFHAFQQKRSADNLVNWAKANPDLWDVVTKVMAYRDNYDGS